MSGIVEYAPADMTVTVEAGVTLADIEQLTAADGLRLALDPPTHSGRATIGGVLASNDSGPLRMVHGGPRDLVVGMTIVMGDGTVVRSGGRVVKNVAGYGVHRLLVGSWGELGMIASATLKLQPRPEALGMAVVETASSEEAEALTSRAMGGELRPTMVEWVRPGERWGASGLAVVLGFEECREAVAWQLEELKRVEPRARILDGSEAAQSYDWIREWGSTAAYQLAMPGSSVWRAFRDIGADVQLLAHAGSGCVLANGDDSGVLARLRAIANECGGCVVRPRTDGEAGHPQLRARLRAALRMEAAAWRA